jgi:hypothetical protein
MGRIAVESADAASMWMEFLPGRRFATVDSAGVQCTA